MEPVAPIAAGGDRLETLEALRDKLADELDNCTYGRDVAVLAARLQSVLADIDTLPPKTAHGAADQILARRQKRRGAAG